MEKFHTRSELTAKISALRLQQNESIELATYVGWTRETLAEHDSRSKVVTDLLTQLESSSSYGE
jgi:hypothetical protein